MSLMSWVMQSNYKRIGDYIRLVDERNSDLSISTLLGLSINKVFIPSVANTVGTDMANYKIIRKSQFSCSLMQVRRDKKIPVALLRDFDEAIISQAYPVFEIIDIEQLLPEYLMMWMSRSEFDRQACFLAVGGVRGSLEWEDFCNMELPIPSPQKQREIVREYHTVTDRIKLNETLNQKLEETAQAIYQQWFVDFEFPDENGNPYKSSGGEMEWCKELELEIPKRWIAGELSSLIDVKNGYAFKSDEFSNKGDLPIIKIKNIDAPNINLNDCQYYNNKINSKLEKYIVENGDILISMTGSHANQMNSAVGKVGRYQERFTSLLNQRVGNLSPLINCKFYVFFFITLKETHLKLLMGATGSANQANISPEQIKNLKVIIPLDLVLNKFEKSINIIMKNYDLVFLENKVLNNFQRILLSKIATVEG